MWTVQCARCRQTATYHPNRWHCPCGGPLTRDLETAGVVFPELYILMGQAYHRRGDSAHSMEAYEKAVDTKKFPLPAYQCSSCGRAQEEWSGFCETCHSWGTFSIHLPEFSQKMPVIPFYNFPARA